MRAAPVFTLLSGECRSPTLYFYCRRVVRFPSSKDQSAPPPPPSAAPAPAPRFPPTKAPTAAPAPAPIAVLSARLLPLTRRLNARFGFLVSASAVPVPPPT